MDGRTASLPGRVLLAGKIMFNSGRSSLDCTVRSLFDGGAYLEVHSPIGIPKQFELTVAGHGEPRACQLEWQTASRVGVSFVSRAATIDREKSVATPASDDKSVQMRGQMLALRAALDEVKFGVLLLDHELRAQFINRAFRKMWQLSDARAESKPAFVALMYHGRDTCAYEIPADELDDYVSRRVALVKAGDPGPIDIRLTNGDVYRYQCAILPNNGRMLSYTNVTDIVRHSDELESLQAALDGVQDGVIRGTVR
jgi:PAS fold